MKLFVPENVFESARSVDDANDHVDVENEYTCPEALTARAPVVRDGRLSVPNEATVDDAYPNEASVVEVLLNVLSAVNILDVYVFGIVVEEFMNELIEALRAVPSTVSAPPTLDRPEPSS